MSDPPPDLLATIVAATRRIVEVRRARRSDAELEHAIGTRPAETGAFEAALARPGGPNVIAECKRRSPSRGVLRAAYDPVDIARRYASAGAAAISVLTEPTFFDGALEHLAAIRRAVPVPLLRKDFVIERYQLLEARAHGADAVLLIVAALSTPGLRHLLVQAADLGLDALVEVHDEDELARAVDVGARLIGVNNRNLRTLAVSLAASERLIARMPPGAIPVAESGISSHQDVLRLGSLGYRAFLVGERLMSSDDPGRALQDLVAPWAPSELQPRSSP